MQPDYEMFIDGQWTGQELDRIDVVNPATDERIASVPKGEKRRPNERWTPPTGPFKPGLRKQRASAAASFSHGTD